MAGVADYLSTRQKYARPQGVIFTNNYMPVNDVYIPVKDGVVTSEEESASPAVEFEDFIILSDHNRSEISIQPQRIETRERMINGRMRSVFLADKYKISTSWKDLPSRTASAGVSIVDGNFVINDDNGSNGSTFVVDLGAGAAELVKWYNDHPGSFYVLLSFDDNKLSGYTTVLECFFDSFNYKINKRGRIMDLWDVELSLEEV